MRQVSKVLMGQREDHSVRERLSTAAKVGWRLGLVWTAPSELRTWDSERRMQDSGEGSKAWDQAAGLYLSEIRKVIKYLLTAQPWCGLWHRGPEIIQDGISNSVSSSTTKLEDVWAQGL